MEKPTHDLDFLSTIFKILGDPTRLRLFSILLNGLHCNCELVSLTGLPNNLISHHMHVLCDAGLIISTRKKEDARWIYYSINQEKIAQIQRAFGSFLKVEDIPVREPECPDCTEKSIKKRGNKR